MTIRVIKPESEALTDSEEHWHWHTVVGVNHLPLEMIIGRLRRVIVRSGIPWTLTCLQLQLM